VTADPAPSFLQSLSPDAVEQVLDALTPRTFAAGADVLVEGERPAEMYVITSGVCGVFVRDRAGSDVQIGQVGVGATIAEFALFEGQSEMINRSPTTLRALTDVEVVSLDPAGFYALAALFPQLLHNVGAILSHRLTSSYRHAVRTQHGRVTVLTDHGGPPLLAFALACSISWHTRAPTILVVIGDSRSPDLEALAARAGPGAEMLLVQPTDGYAPAALAGTIENLQHQYEHVLVLAVDRDGEAAMPTAEPVRIVRLTDAGSALSGSDDARAGHTVRAWIDSAPPNRPDAQGVLHIPPLGPADDRAMQDGSLPTTTAAGRALGWLARDLSGLKVGVALGAGSVRGYAHYGVLRVFERIGLSADYIAGTSIGAIIAASYALGHSADRAARTMEETSSRAFKLTVPVHSLLSNAGVAANFREVAGVNTRIEDLDTPLAMIAADLNSGREVVFRRGLVRVAALATMAIPGIYPPVRMGSSVLVDGGVVNPVPISVVSSMGADVIIAVALGRPGPAPILDAEAVEERGRLPSLVHTIAHSVEIMQTRIGSQAGAAATVLIQPDFAAVPSVGLHSFNLGRPYIAPGEAAAEAALPEIAAVLPWLRT
jgi:NTE family protein